MEKINRNESSKEENLESGSNLERDRKINQLKEDYETDWWKANDTDDYNLKKKLLRVGCRPLKRKFLAC